jgi:hypothetical protein
MTDDQPQFVLDHAVIGQIAKFDPGLMAAVDAAAESVHSNAGVGASIHHYTTDRHVAGITVPAIDQAKHGKLTRAAGITAAEISQNND